MATGEIVSSADSSPSRRRVRVTSITKDVGVETKYPADCVTEDSLLDSLRQLDALLHHKPNIDYAYLTDSITEKLLTVTEVSVLTHLSKQLTGWNYWMGSLAALNSSLPGVNIARTLSSLVEKNAIRILHRDKPFRHCLVLQVNPVIAFKGSHMYRDSHIKRWYGAGEGDWS